MNEHTPGPWTLHEADERDDDGTRLFNIHPVERLAYIREADARLIAATPDLLAALEFYADESNGERLARIYLSDPLTETYISGPAWDAGERARAAIAKTRGQQEAPAD